MTLDHYCCYYQKHVWCMFLMMTPLHPTNEKNFSNKFCVTGSTVTWLMMSGNQARNKLVRPTYIQNCKQSLISCCYMPCWILKDFLYFLCIFILLNKYLMMMMMMMMMMMINSVCGMADRRKGFSLISSRDHCQRFSPSRISDTPWEGFNLAPNLRSSLVEWSCTVVLPTTPRRHL